MDILARLKELQKNQGWTNYRTAKESGLSQNTIVNIYVRNNIPTIPTIEALCHAFGITVAQFFTEGESVDLTPEQRELLDRWATLDEEQKRLLKQLIEKMK